MKKLSIQGTSLLFSFALLTALLFYSCQADQGDKIREIAPNNSPAIPIQPPYYLNERIAEMPLLDYRLKEQELFNIADSLLSFELFKTQEQYSKLYTRYHRLHPQDWLIVHRFYSEISKERMFKKGEITEEQYRYFLAHPEASSVTRYEEIIRRSGTSYLKSSKEIKKEVRKEFEEKAKNYRDPEMERIFNIPSDQSSRSEVDATCPYVETCLCFKESPLEGNFYNSNGNFSAANCCNRWGEDYACEVKASSASCDFFFRFNLDASDDTYCFYFWSSDNIELYTDIIDAYEDYGGDLSGNIELNQNQPHESKGAITLGRSIIGPPLFGFWTTEMVQLHLKMIYTSGVQPPIHPEMECFSLTFGVNCFIPD